MSTRAGEPVPPVPDGASLDMVTEGETIYQHGEFGTSFYTLVEARCGCNLKPMVNGTRFSQDSSSVKSR